MSQASIPDDDSRAVHITETKEAQLRLMGRDAALEYFIGKNLDQQHIIDDLIEERATFAERLMSLDYQKRAILMQLHEAARDVWAAETKLMVLADLATFEPKAGPPR